MKCSLVIFYTFFVSALFGQGVNTDKNNLALAGYDPVSYFSEKAPVKGKSELSYTYQGAIYKFSSVANKARFEKEPSTYAPAYGGYCAFAMGKNGDKVSVNPLSYKIEHKKLMLFYDNALVHTLKLWDKDSLELFKNAELNWKKIK